jgi:hypothetical protein
VKALKEAEELPEFTELQNETKSLIKTHQQSLKPFEADVKDSKRRWRQTE